MFEEENAHGPGVLEDLLSVLANELANEDYNLFVSSRRSRRRRRGRRRLIRHCRAVNAHATTG